MLLEEEDRPEVEPRMLVFPGVMLWSGEEEGAILSSGTASGILDRLVFGSFSSGGGGRGRFSGGGGGRSPHPGGI